MNTTSEDPLRITVKQLDTPEHGVDLEEMAESHWFEFNSSGADSREFSREGVVLYTSRYGPQRVRNELNCWLA